MKLVVVEERQMITTEPEVDRDREIESTWVRAGDMTGQQNAMRTIVDSIIDMITVKEGGMSGSTTEPMMAETEIMTETETEDMVTETETEIET